MILKSCGFQCLLLILLTVLLVTPTHGQIYQWKDKNGVVHYGDRAKMGKSPNSKQLNVKDKYAVAVVEPREVIPYQGGATSRTVVISNIILDLPKSEDKDVLVGRVVCGKPVDLYWVNGLVSLDRKNLGSRIANVIEQHGYLARQGDPVREAGDLRLTAKIKRIFMNTCPKNTTRQLTQDSTYLKVEWTLHDLLKDKDVLVFETRGSHHGIGMTAVAVSGGRAKSFDSAMSMAVNNALSNKDFAEAIGEDVGENIAKLDADDITLKLSEGNTFRSFQKGANFLKERTAIVKTKGGHGSGVFIAQGGYILTNAHVVGDETEFRIESGVGNYKATLVRKNPSRDVALLKVEAHRTLDSVAISKKPIDIGASLFVIGTPLDIKFSHTITRGIVSAKRIMRGLDYIQTDAAINFGNSGGPVFDAKGDLVAITVSSVMTREGASLNINYLIPIDDALKKLNVNGLATTSSTSTFNPLASITKAYDTGIDGEPLEGRQTVAEQLKDGDLANNTGALGRLYRWLDQPLFNEE